jgi:hypothetical protein
MLLIINASVPAAIKKTTDEMMNIIVRSDRFLDILYNGDGPCSWSYSFSTLVLLSSSSNVTISSPKP